MMLSFPSDPAQTMNHGCSIPSLQSWKKRWGFVCVFILGTFQQVNVSINLFDGSFDFNLSIQICGRHSGVRFVGI